MTTLMVFLHYWNQSINLCSFYSIQYSHSCSRQRGLGDRGSVPKGRDDNEGFRSSKRPPADRGGDQRRWHTHDRLTVYVERKPKEIHPEPQANGKFLTLKSMNNKLPCVWLGVAVEGIRAVDTGLQHDVLCFKKVGKKICSLIMNATMVHLVLCFWCE